MQELFPQNQSDRYVFNGAGINLSADSASIINMLDAYSYLSVGSNKQPYNAFCCGSSNSWLNNKLNSIYPAFYDGGWNSNNFATSILDSGGVNSNSKMLPSSPGFGTSLPNLSWWKMSLCYILPLTSLCALMMLAEFLLIYRSRKVETKVAIFLSAFHAMLLISILGYLGLYSVQQTAYPNWIHGDSSRAVGFAFADCGYNRSIYV